MDFHFKLANYAQEASPATMVGNKIMQKIVWLSGKRIITFGTTHPCSPQRLPPFTSPWSVSGGHAPSLLLQPAIHNCHPLQSHPTDHSTAQSHMPTIATSVSLHSQRHWDSSTAAATNIYCQYPQRTITLNHSHTVGNRVLHPLLCFAIFCVFFCFVSLASPLSFSVLYFFWMSSFCSYLL